MQETATSDMLPVSTWRMSSGFSGHTSQALIVDARVYAKVDK